MISLAVAEPPGEFTRSTTALMLSSAAALFSAARIGVLAGLGVPHTDAYAAVVALAIVATLLLQALPAEWLARRLGLLDGEVVRRPV